MFSPLGVIQAEAGQAGVLVHEIDLSFEIVGYQKDEGKSLTLKFGDRIGFNYYTGEDSGICWSNDPTTPIGEMLGSIGIPDMDEDTRHARAAQDRVRGGPPSIP